MREQGWSKSVGSTGCTSESRCAWRAQLIPTILAMAEPQLPDPMIETFFGGISCSIRIFFGVVILLEQLYAQKVCGARGHAARRRLA